MVDAWVLDYDWRTAAAVAFGASCALAVLVNLSQFMCLGRFTAVSYQVGFRSSRVLATYRRSAPGVWRYWSTSAAGADQLQHVNVPLESMCTMQGHQLDASGTDSSTSSSLAWPGC